MKPEIIAMVAHTINKAYCEALGDMSQKSWDEAEDILKDSVITGVGFALANPNITPEESHASWLAYKEEEGWKYGKVKDVEKKLHPCMVPYDELPADHKMKDTLFLACVSAMDAIEMPTVKVPVNIEKVPVKYVSFRPEYTDGMYGTGLWKKDQTKLIDVDTAKKMFAHPDVYVPGEDQEADEMVDSRPPGPKPDDSPDLEEGRMDVMNMKTKAEIVEFVGKNFGGLKLEMPARALVADYKKEAVRLIDQYHLPE